MRLVLLLAACESMGPGAQAACCLLRVAYRPAETQPTTTPLGFVADLLKWLGAISRFLNIYTILITIESPLETKRFAFETCTQALSDMCITTILFKYHTGSEYPGIHVQLRYVFAGILKQRRFVTCDFASLLGVLS